MSNNISSHSPAAPTYTPTVDASFPEDAPLASQTPKREAGSAPMKDGWDQGERSARLRSRARFLA